MSWNVDKWYEQYSRASQTRLPTGRRLRAYVRRKTANLKSAASSSMPHVGGSRPLDRAKSSGDSSSLYVVTEDERIQPHDASSSSSSSSDQRASSSRRGVTFSDFRSGTDSDHPATTVLLHEPHSDSSTTPTENTRLLDAIDKSQFSSFSSSSSSSSSSHIDQFQEQLGSINDESSVSTFHDSPQPERQQKNDRSPQQQHPSVVFKQDDENSSVMTGSSRNFFSDNVTWKEKITGWRKEAIKRFPYYVPIFEWLPKYQWKSQGIGDLLAGVSVAMMLIPQCLAYALLAHLPPIVGLYTGWMPVVIYTIFGTSKQLAIGPEGLISLLIGSTLYNFAENNGLSTRPEDLVPYAIILSFLVGLVTLFLGIIRVGFLDNLISRPILSGFITASAIIIMVQQINLFWGVPLEGEHPYEILGDWFEKFTELNALTLGIGIGCLILMVSIEYGKGRLGIYWPWIKLIPTTLVVVAVGIGIGAGLEVEKRGVSILGDVSGGFPVPRMPEFWDLTALQDLIVPAILISLIGFVESMAIGKKYAAKHHYQVSANRELVALGTSNLIGSCFISYPTFGSLPRSVVAEMAGSSSQLVGFIASCFVLACILFLMPLFHYLPDVTIAALIMVAAAGLIEVEDIYFLWKVRAWADLVLAAITFLTTFFLGPELGIIIALGISLFLVVKHTTMPHISVLGITPDGKYRDLVGFPSAQLIPGVLVIRIDESLYFGNIGQIKEMFTRIERLGNHRAHPTDKSVLPQTQISGIVVDCRNINLIDANAIQILAEMAHSYQKRGVTLCFVKLRPIHRKKLMWAAEVTHAMESSDEDEPITPIDQKQAPRVGPESFHHRIAVAIQFLQSKDGQFEYSTYQV